MRSVLVFLILLGIKCLSRLFYRIEARWVGEVPTKPWSKLRVVAFLNHTSLFEPVFAGASPNSFIWRLARHGVVPMAEKTVRRPLVGMLFKLIAANVVSITRERDHTWRSVLATIDPDSMVVIAPEGRMKRANGLDLNGQPLSVRGGIADILEAVPSGRMLIVVSAGLHHVQAPGERLPRLFRRVRMRLEDVEIERYRAGLLAGRLDGDLKTAVKEDLERRRDRRLAELAAEGPVS